MNINQLTSGSDYNPDKDIAHNQDFFIECIIDNQIGDIFEYLNYSEESKYYYYEDKIKGYLNLVNEETDDNKYKQEILFLDKYIDLLFKEAKKGDGILLSIFKEKNEDDFDKEKILKSSVWLNFCELLKGYFGRNFTPKCIEILEGTPIRKKKADEERIKLEQEIAEKQEEERKRNEMYKKAREEGDYKTLARLLDVDEEGVKALMIDCGYNIKE